MTAPRAPKSSIVLGLSALALALTVTLGVALTVTLSARPAEAAPPQLPGVDLVEAWPDLEFKEPICITNAGDGSDYLYVGEQPGRIMRIKKYRGVGAVPRPTVFLDIRSQCYARAQGGLLDVAFHPDFKTNRKFYVSYLAKNTAPGRGLNEYKLVIAEYSSGGTTANVNSRRTVIEIPKKSPQHQAGGIGFGPDKMLYIGVGDGGSKMDVDGNAQNALVLLGKVLRIDPAGRIGNLGYGIPRNNPWAHQKFRGKEFFLSCQRMFRGQCGLDLAKCSQSNT